MFGHRVRGKSVKYRWKNLWMFVDLDLNSMVVEHRIDQFIFPLLKKVRPKKLVFRLKPVFHYSGSVADKAGLGVDDEVVSMNDENIENMNFDQVRKILKERNLRGSIKLIVRTYEGMTALFTASTLSMILSLLLAQIYLMIILKQSFLHRLLITVEHHHHINLSIPLLHRLCLLQLMLNYPNLLLFHQDLPLH